MRRHRLHALVLPLLLLAGACSTPRGSSASSSSAASDASDERVDWNVKPPQHAVTGHPVRVTYLAFASGRKFELVNESHTNPHEYYSQKVPIEQAYRKIQSDEVVQALLDRLKEQGALDQARAGAAQSFPAGSKAQALEIQMDGGVRHWLVTDQSPADERTRFLKSANDFVQLWNATIQMQAVDSPPEWNGTSQGKPASKPKRPGSTAGKVQ
ncbi:MAG: hypothetical protein IPJ77_02560 [Planctomycetes bacterium]|nr:hypothetical protein [Planctomycetota bacterium]